MISSVEVPHRNDLRIPFMACRVATDAGAEKIEKKLIGQCESRTGKIRAFNLTQLEKAALTLKTSLAQNANASLALSLTYATVGSLIYTVEETSRSLKFHHAMNRRLLGNLADLSRLPAFEKLLVKTETRGWARLPMRKLFQDLNFKRRPSFWIMVGSLVLFWNYSDQDSTVTRSILEAVPEAVFGKQRLQDGTWVEKELMLQSDQAIRNLSNALDAELKKQGC